MPRPPTHTFCPPPNTASNFEREFAHFCNLWPQRQESARGGAADELPPKQAARVVGIVGLLTKDFLLLVLPGSLIAAPVAWWGMSNWLQNFSSRIDIGWWVFGVAAAVAVLVAFATVSFQIVRAAMVNPLESLRSE